MDMNESTGTDSGASRRRSRSLGESPEELKVAAEDLASSVEQFYRVGDAFLSRHAEDKPYVILGAAAGLGFVLGGGLASRLAGTLVSLLGRMAVTHAVDTWVASNVSGAHTP